MAISEEQKEEIRAKVDIADLASSYGLQLKQNGSGLWCCCPFHTEKTPSFKVDSTRGTYHCFGCGESGDIFDFVQKQEGLSFGEAIRKLAEIAGVELTNTVSPMERQRKRLYELMAALAIDFNRMLKSPKAKDAEIAREYLKSRGLDGEIADKFLIGYAPANVNKILVWANHHGYTMQELAAAGIIKLSDVKDRLPYFYFANRLIFTVKDKNGRVVAFSGRQLVEDKKSGKYINSPETLIFKKSRTFFAYDEARKYIVKAPNREAIVCEGQIDCIRLHSSGFNTAVAPLGTAFTEEHAVLLHRVADTALLCFDDDAAGHKATIKAAGLLLAEGMPMRVLSLPNGEDPDSYIQKNGKDAFGKLIDEKAESIVSFQIRAEWAKEKDKTDVNAKIRVTKAVLETIAQCKDGVQREILLKEAAKGLDVEYAVLAKEIADSVKKNVEESQSDAEQLIEPPIAGKAENAVNLPNITEGSLICYLMENEGNAEIRDCLPDLIPEEVFRSPMTRQIVKAWLEDKTAGSDPIRDVVEHLSEGEYKCFIGLMTNLDGTGFSSLSHKNRIVYFARQIWHEYLIRKLETIKGDVEKTKMISNALKTLHTATAKGVVHLISTFPLTKISS